MHLISETYTLLKENIAKGVVVIKTFILKKPFNVVVINKLKRAIKHFTLKAATPQRTTGKSKREYAIPQGEWILRNVFAAEPGAIPGLLQNKPPSLQY